MWQATRRVCHGGSRAGGGCGAVLLFVPVVVAVALGLCRPEPPQGDQLYVWTVCSACQGRGTTCCGSGDRGSMCMYMLLLLLHLAS